MSSKLFKDKMQERYQSTHLHEFQRKPGRTSSGSSLFSNDSLGSSCGSLSSQCLLGEVNGHERYSHHSIHFPSTTCSPIYESQGLASKRDMTEWLGTARVREGNTPPHLKSIYSGDSNPSYSQTVSPLNEELTHGITEIPDCRSVRSSLFDKKRDKKEYEDEYKDESYKSYTAFPLTSYQSTMGSTGNLACQLGRSVQNGGSNQFVVADSGRDSGVFEDSIPSSGAYSDDNIETAQIRIGLEYNCPEEKLLLTVEKGRNIKVLCYQPLQTMHVKCSLLPSSGGGKFCIRSRNAIITDRPTFNEQFLFTIDRNNLISKTLQVQLYGLLTDSKQEECLGSTQISLGEFDSELEIGLKWYNLLDHVVKTSHNISRCNSYNESQLSSESRNRSKSIGERDTVNTRISQSNLAGNSLSGSTECLCLRTPQRVASCRLQPLRSRSGEQEERIHGSTMGRSVSDCSGYRSGPRAQFVRMGAGRRSVRQKNRCEIKQKTVLAPVVKKDDKKFTIDGMNPINPLDLEEELKAAYSKQESLNEEIYRLKEMKQLMEAGGKGEREDLPKWLVENGENFDALLHEAKREVSSHLLGRKLDQKLASLAITNKFEEPTRGLPKRRVVDPPTRDVHWV